MNDQANEANVVTINLSYYGGPVYVGRPRGQQARKDSKLDETDLKKTNIILKVPEDAYAVNSSFLLGLLDKSIQSCGSREEFWNRFKIEASQKSWDDFLTLAIETALDVALTEKKPLLGG